MSTDPLEDIFRPKRSLLQRFFVFWAKVAAGVLAFFVLFAVIFYFGVKADDQRQIDQALQDRSHAAQVEQAIANKRIMVGMTPAQVALVMGKPDRSTASGGVGKDVEIWHYENLSVTFVDGGLTRWVKSR